ncbi:MAG: hypothetical protein JNJ94_15840 [Chlorobi bacterium]|nr:hypothetical protein [Chlorobiota bacterium]
MNRTENRVPTKSSRKPWLSAQQQNIRIGLNELQIDGSGWPSGSHRVRVQIGETVMNKVFILRR